MPPKAFEDYSLQQLWALQHKFNKQLHRRITSIYTPPEPLKNSLDKRILGVNEQGYDSFHEGDVQETAAYEERHFNDKIVTCDFIGDAFKRDRDGGSAKMAKRHLYTGSSPAPAEVVEHLVSSQWITEQRKRLQVSTAGAEPSSVRQSYSHFPFGHQFPRVPDSPDAGQMLDPNRLAAPRQNNLVHRNMFLVFCQGYGSIIKGRRHLIGHHAAAHEGLARAAASIDSSPQELDYR
ncbi:hypothetical protein SELMODRAFT_409997 [Selaginella moellendorffii]|uniref:Uncharacterized protein n=1 Tax=Selaginella moellendorffii TaxID=88036 RepID=D8RD48_SELML|nr:hypothetical protein SELMODRAFT_409997 [Selaginella moellendorffii]